MKRPRVMSVDGRRMVDPTAMEAYCIGAESTIARLRKLLDEAGPPNAGWKTIEDWFNRRDAALAEKGK